MIKEIKNKVVNFVGAHTNKLRPDEYAFSPESIKALFILSYKNLNIAELLFEDSSWNFSYTDDFKDQDEIQPIVEFPDLDAHYKSEKLWPFFILRIPSLAQLVAKSQEPCTDEVKLLKDYGENAIANPFSLRAVEEA